MEKIYLEDSDGVNKENGDGCNNSCKVEPGWNKIVANAMSGITCGMRLSGPLNSGLIKAAVNLIVFPECTS